jgi:hypothetical protein
MALFFSCHLTSVPHSGGHAQSWQDDGLQQNPDSDKQQKGNDFVHKISPVLYWDSGSLSTVFRSPAWQAAAQEGRPDGGKGFKIVSFRAFFNTLPY